MSDEDYKEQAKLVYELVIESLKFTATAQADYGKWLINTLWLMHSGAIVGLVFRAGGGRPPYLGSLWWFVAGIALAFAAGFAAWWNFTFARDRYQAWVQPSMLTDPSKWPKKDDTNASIGMVVTWWLAIAAGLLSLACLVGGAAAIYSSWRS